VKDLSKYTGCLIGGAVGDALGYAVEFLDTTQIKSVYGEKGIRRYKKTEGLARISDDTQMTLFTANGLLLGITRGLLRGIMGPMEGYIHCAYLDWLYTQTDVPVADTHYTWLRNVKRLHYKRAPGNTCLTALESGICGTISKPINNSKGCGGVMRVAPIGLYFCEHEDESLITMLGAKTAAITHGHPLGYIPAATLTNIIFNCFNNDMGSLKEVIIHSIEYTQNLFSEYAETVYLGALLKKAISLAESKNDDIANIEKLGEGWVAEETLAIAVYCSLKYHSDFEKAIVASVNHKGDSDSTGAVTGNILGTWLGIDNIPDYYKENLELSDVIYDISQDLFNDCKMSEYSSYRDEVWENKYIHTAYTA
jgi:ADP-ribosylglycohydrolase